MPGPSSVWPCGGWATADAPRTRCRRRSRRSGAARAATGRSAGPAARGSTRWRGSRTSWRRKWMDRGRPEFRELVGDDLTPEERARLERVHELLVAAGPPPELPPALAEPPGESEPSPMVLPRRRAGAILAL